MTAGERRATFSMAGILGLRMLGLFMILPVFALYAEHLSGVTPFLVGVAIGAYGITQAVFQIPFGLLSDRLGRKPVIVAGLLLFAVGSVVAAVSDSVFGVIAGRALQGTGAIASAMMALLADLTREQQRTKAMAVMGVSIGMSFAAAMVLGPLLDHWVGVAGIFWFTAVLALAGVGALLLWVPTPARTRSHRDAQPVPAQFADVLRNGQLLRLDFGILCLHTLLTATFVILPLVLHDELGLASARHGVIYLGVMVAAIAAMVPFIVVAEKKRRMKPVFLGAVAALALAELALWRWHGGLPSVVGALFVFFTGFNILEASLPSLVSKVAPSDSKGTAMGVYSTSQFLGAFLGGAIGGWLHGAYSLDAVFLFGALLAALWLLVAAGMRQPRHLTSYLLPVGRMDAVQAQLLAARLAEVPGVAEAVVVAEDEVAYLKVDSRTLDEGALSAYAAA